VLTEDESDDVEDFGAVEAVAEEAAGGAEDGVGLAEGGVDELVLFGGYACHGGWVGGYELSSVGLCYITCDDEFKFVRQALCFGSLFGQLSLVCTMFNLKYCSANDFTCGSGHLVCDRYSRRIKYQGRCQSSANTVAIHSQGKSPKT